MKPKYHDQYCEKHKQWYGEHLHKCPICVGEQMGQQNPKIITDKLVQEDKGV
jgi:hypothetical protein